ncbi:MAG: DUF4093 domain-containing protein [Oscillospiraceae bacterium]|nr:DUF4093 domain-containing protein [Oscillospiraceae bacterium]
MLKLREAILVEGRYDKIALENVVDTEIFTSEGFGIFHDRKKMELLRRIAEHRGLIVFTDADGAGLVIRNRIRGCIDSRYLKHAYIPEIMGKERRKKTPSGSGLLGVEGMDAAVLEEALLRAGAERAEDDRPRITKADLYAAGLSGGANAAEKRKALLHSLDLPGNLSSNAMLDVLNSLYTPDDFLSAADTIQKERPGVSQEQDGG